MGNPPLFEENLPQIYQQGGLLNIVEIGENAATGQICQMSPLPNEKAGENSGVVLALKAGTIVLMALTAVSRFSLPRTHSADFNTFLTSASSVTSST